METVESLTRDELNKSISHCKTNLRAYRKMLTVPRDKRKISLRDKEIREFIEMEITNLAILGMALSSIPDDDIGQRIDIYV